MIKAVIFDMDGLLIDSEPFWREADISALASVGVQIPYKRTNETIGIRVDEAVEYWYRQFHWEKKTKKDVEALIIRHVVDSIRAKGEPQPGAKEIIRMFAEKKVPLGLASSSPSEVINAVLDRLGVRKFFIVVRSAEHESYGKPHPGVFIRTAEELGVYPDECLVFEDSPSGVLAAKAARMTCVAVPYIELKDDPRFCIADMQIESLTAFTWKNFEKLKG